MLNLKKITKIYNTGGPAQKALKSVSVSFRESEFAAILGPSGSGKTTLLNIIGGLDHYTHGDLIINGISTKRYKSRDWDTYRNHRVGFVFQNYNLISHQTILTNVRLALTLSGISKKTATARAHKALQDVGLGEHIHKRPSQLSGGQMQRVAIARALVNDPDILLADEPTGALDSETSVQIMDLLRQIAQTKLVVMVTHNPELADEYATRIIKLKDGRIISDSSPYTESTTAKPSTTQPANRTRKTSMSFRTALSLSFNNLMTKKGRTLLVAFAGSIGIIGIALILAVSTGFQRYVDGIQEDTLNSYPLTLMQESADITGTLLALTSGSGASNGTNQVTETQYLTSMLGNISANDLASFRKHLNTNYDEVRSDLSDVEYRYNIDPNIYTVDATSKLAKLNPSNLLSSTMGSSSLMSSYSSLTSTFYQMVGDYDAINSQYDILAGHLPKNYNEMIIVLPEPNSIPDMLVYSLGFRDTNELTEIVTKVMSGESVDFHNDPLTLTYDDLLNTKLKLIQPADTYQYNTKYDVYEDMSSDTDYMQRLYDQAEPLHIVGILTAKEGTTSTALTPGIAYTSDLIAHIIDHSAQTDIVKRQLASPDVDVFSGARFDAKTNDYNFEFSDLVSVDTAQLQRAFNVDINPDTIKQQASAYMTDIQNSITVDTTPALNAISDNFNNLSSNLAANLPSTFSLSDIDGLVSNFVATPTATDIFCLLESGYTLPYSVYQTAYSGLLQGLLINYVYTYYAIDPTLTTDPANPVAQFDFELFNSVNNTYLNTPAIIQTFDTLARNMTEASVKKSVLTKVSSLTTTLSNSFANAFHVDQDAIISAFKLNFTEDELTRVVTAMVSNTKTKSTATTNLSLLGYQNPASPSRISFYFSSFDGKEHFMQFIDAYNSNMESTGQDDKVIEYSDTVGILTGSVKTIVDAVSYVLIAFVSISLVVSSIMIGVITYISVYERTKEIGILRAIGASKHNISSIFNAETFIIGLLSGLIGIGVSYALIPIINAILHHFTGNIPLAASLDPSSAAILVAISIILTLIGGIIPARAASKKDPVEALRSE